MPSLKKNVVPNTMVLIQLLIKSTTSLNNYIETAFLRNTVQSFGRIASIYQGPKLPIQIIHGCL